MEAALRRYAMDAGTATRPTDPVPRLREPSREIDLCAHACARRAGTHPETPTGPRAQRSGSRRFRGRIVGAIGVEPTTPTVSRSKNPAPARAGARKPRSFACPGVPREEYACPQLCARACARGGRAHSRFARDADRSTVRVGAPLRERRVMSRPKPRTGHGAGRRERTAHEQR